MSEKNVKEAAKKGWYRKLMDLNPNRKKTNEAYDKAREKRKKKKEAGY